MARVLWEENKCGSLWEKAAGADCSCQAARLLGQSEPELCWERREDEEEGGQVQGPHHVVGPVLRRGPHLAISRLRMPEHNMKII